MPGVIPESRRSGEVRRGLGFDRPARVKHRLGVLVVEQPEVVRDLSAALAGQPIELDSHHNAAEALLILGRTNPDAVLLGPVGGDLDPLDFIRIVRSHDATLPILAGAGMGSADFAAGATSAGATVVVPRPYRGAELLAMLRSLTPRAEMIRLRPLPIDLGRLRIDGAIPQMWVDGRQVQVPPMEFALLRYFAEHAGEALSREELIDAVWGSGAQQGVRDAGGGGRGAHSNTLTVHIMRLRKRLAGDSEDVEWIRSVRGHGYQFRVPE